MYRFALVLVLATGDVALEFGPFATKSQCVEFRSKVHMKLRPTPGPTLRYVECRLVPVPLPSSLRRPSP